MSENVKQCSCGKTYTVYRFLPMSQDVCPECRAEERRERRLIGSSVPAFQRDDLIFTKKQCD